jgi:hypothetical protein
MTSVDSSGKTAGVRRRLAGPGGETYLLQAARSGFVQWSYLAPQSIAGWLLHTAGTALVNRLVFWGGWTVVVWQGDEFAPMRRTVCKRRYRTRQDALAGLEDLAVTIQSVRSSADVIA